MTGVTLAAGEVAGEITGEVLGAVLGCGSADCSLGATAVVASVVGSGAAVRNEGLGVVDAQAPTRATIGTSAAIDERRRAWSVIAGSFRERAVDEFSPRRRPSARDGRRTDTIVVCGVAGVGKSSVAAALADRLDAEAAEGDAFHPEANVAKMAAGTPLTDEDRWPWLRSIADWIGERERLGQDAVVTCSALRRRYRDVLRDGHPSVVFVQLTAPVTELRRRLATRAGHYMPASLLPSQLATLEPLEPDEPGFVLAADREPGVLAATILDRLGRPSASDAGSERDAANDPERE
jgi:gluconokinase